MNIVAILTVAVAVLAPATHTVQSEPAVVSVVTLTKESISSYAG